MYALHLTSIPMVYIYLHHVHLYAHAMYGTATSSLPRFAYHNTINQLPKWVRPFVHTYDKFGLIQRDLTQFFRNAEKKVHSQ